MLILYMIIYRFIGISKLQLVNIISKEYKIQVPSFRKSVLLDCHNIKKKNCYYHYHLNNDWHKLPIIRKRWNFLLLFYKYADGIHYTILKSLMTSSSLNFNSQFSWFFCTCKLLLFYLQSKHTNFYENLRIAVGMTDNNLLLENSFDLLSVYFITSQINVERICIIL